MGAALAAVLFRVVRPDDFGGSDKYNLSTKCVSEFIGTYVLIFTVGLNVLGQSPAGAFSIAASLMCMVFALGNCSGAHFNPAVTVALLCSGRDCIPGGPTEAGAFILSQIVGGITAAGTYVVMMKGETFPLGPVEPYNW